MKPRLRRPIAHDQEGVSDLAAMKEMLERSGLRHVEYPNQRGWSLLVQDRNGEVVILFFDENFELKECEVQGE